MTKVEFGFNTDSADAGEFIAWAHIGTKYNFNISGNLLGIYSANDKKYMLSEVTTSFGNNCMVGTVDAREVIKIFDEIYVSNNDISEDAMTIARVLSSKEMQEYLKNGGNIESTKEFQDLEIDGIKLQKAEEIDAPSLGVHGIEPDHFELLKQKRKTL